MNNSERWAAIGAIGAILAGLAAVFPAIQHVLNLLPSIRLPVLHLVGAAGFAIGGGGALMATWLAWKARRAASHAGVAAAGHGGPDNRELYLLLAIVGVLVAAGVSLAATGVGRTVERTVGWIGLSTPPVNDTRTNSLEKVCADARRKFETRAGRAGQLSPVGSWTGWATWFSVEQQWAFAQDGSLRLTRGQPGLWRMEGEVIVITFQRQTIFRALRFGELLCGVRVQPDAAQPDGNFQMVLVAPAPATPSTPQEDNSAS